MKKLLCLLAVLGLTTPGYSQDPQPSARAVAPVASANFPLETLNLKSGSKYEGLVLNETEQQLEFAEVVRPPGRKMYAIVRAVPQKDVAKLKRLDEKQKAAATAWFEKFRRQSDFAAAQAESLSLNRLRIGDQLGWQYSGRWFDLASTADEVSTRRVIVRLEQLFLAFRQVLPPRVTPSDPPLVLIYGHRDEYRDRLREWNLKELNNPAFYASNQKTIVASCSLGQIARHAGDVSREQKDLERRLKERTADLTASLAVLAEDMRRKGYPPDEVKTEIRARTSQWESEQADEKKRLADVQRRNKQKLEEASNTFFRRLAHEAFHAYAENFVFPAEQGRMPRWLNEGLAQIFEAAPLDVDHLRIDAPDPQRKAALRTELNARQPLSLASVLTADEEQFLLAHDRDQMDRLYLYSWGLAWQLIFADQSVKSDQIDHYLALEKEGLEPAARFEKLVGKPLPEWEKTWREKWRK